jgi:hypothetical protein
MSAPLRDKRNPFANYSDDRLKVAYRDIQQREKLLKTLNRKSWDADAEAVRMRALSAEERQGLYRETLVAVNFARAELRRRSP